MSADQMSVDEMSLGQKVFRQKCVELFEQGAEKYFLLKKRLSKKKPQPLLRVLVIPHSQKQDWKSKKTQKNIFHIFSKILPGPRKTF